MKPSRQGGRIFPIPERKMPRPCSSTSHRLNTRHRVHVAETELGNGAIRALNSLYSNISPSSSTTRSQFPTSSSINATLHIQLCAQRYSRNHELTKRRKGFPSASASTPLKRGSLAGFPEASANKYAAPSPAVRLVASRVALPPADAAGSVELLSILPPDIQKTYESYNPDLFRPPEEVKPAPHILLADRTEYVALVRRMM